MPKSLVIVESPTKARTIAGYLGAGYDVKSSMGHIRDLPQSDREVPDEKRETHGRLAGINPHDHFDVVYVVPSGKKKVVAELKRALKGADELILATDEDREGEAISWHVLEVLKPSVPVKRMVFHEITPHAIRDALEQPRELDMKLVEAQEGRRVLDRLVGWETSPVLWRRVAGAKSAGRVQSVAVRLVVDRERARMAFRSGSWFDLEGVFEARGAEFAATLSEVGGSRVAEGRDFDPATGRLAEGAGVVLLDETEAAGLAERLRYAPFGVESVESKRAHEKPRPPFTTSTVQQEAGSKLRFGAAKTMAVAQRLYERGYITYMRTDSTNLSEQAVTAARAAIEEEYGAEYLPPQPRAYRTKVKNAQEAHEAIRPAGDRIRTPSEVRPELDGDEAALYELIWMRTVACQMADARALKTSIRLSATSSAGEAVVFTASGKTYEFLGWRKAYVESTDDAEAEREALLPAVSEGDPVRCVELAPAGHETKPPARYTEATLVRELEQRGIGRPSTYASVIQTIQSRDYVWKKGTALVPSWTAFAVVRLLEDYFGHLVDYGFTATMEEALDVIARGEGEAEKWLHSFYFGNGDEGLRDLVAEENLDRIDAREINTIPLGEDAEGRPVVVRVGRYGPFVQRGESENASLPPDLAPDELTLDLAAELIERQAEGPQSLGADPATALPVYVLTGRYGPYVQLGDQIAGSKKKPPRASLFKSMTPETVTLEEALLLLLLPRVVGVDDEGREITARNGRFGPYIDKAGETRSLDSEEQLLTLTVAEAEALFAQPKRGRGRAARPSIAELGPHPETGAPVRVLDGQYGAYATDGTTNATLPRGTDPEAITLEEAVVLLRAKAEAGPRRPPSMQTKRVKKATKKVAKKAAKRPARKVAKKAAKKAATRTAKQAAGARAESGDAAAEGAGGEGAEGVAP